MFDGENKSLFYSLHLLRNGKVSLKKGFTNGKKVKLLASKRKLFNLDRPLFDGGSSVKAQ